MGRWLFVAYAHTVSNREPLRLSFVTEWFPPEVNGVVLWIAQAMRGQGFDVGVVTGVPHYPTGKIAEGYSGTRRVFDVVEGFRTVRVPEYPSHDTSAARRFATYASFAISGSALGGRTIGESDVTLVYSSPATSALPAMYARVRFGTPYVLLIQDLWPDSIFATGFLKNGAVKSLAEPAVNAFVQASYRAASHICVISPGMRRALVERGVAREKVSVVYNWVNETVLSPAPRDGELRRRLGLGENAFVAMFAGNAGEAQGLRAWLAAMSLISDLEDVHLVFLGGGTQRKALKMEAKSRGTGARVHFLDPVPPLAMPPLVADADVSIVSLADRPLFEFTLPSKVQASLAMASPIIASCAGDPADVVRESGSGWIADPENPGSIARAIREAYMAGRQERVRRGLVGRRYYERHMAQDIGSRRLAEALRTASLEGPGR